MLCSQYEAGNLFVSVWQQVSQPLLPEARSSQQDLQLSSKHPDPPQPQRQQVKKLSSLQHDGQLLMTSMSSEQTAETADLHAYKEVTDASPSGLMLSQLHSASDPSSQQTAQSQPEYLTAAVSQGHKPSGFIQPTPQSFQSQLSLSYSNGRYQQSDFEIPDEEQRSHQSARSTALETGGKVSNKTSSQSLKVKDSHPFHSNGIPKLQPERLQQDLQSKSMADEKQSEHASVASDCTTCSQDDQTLQHDSAVSDSRRLSGVIPSSQLGLVPTDFRVVIPDTANSVSQAGVSELRQPSPVVGGPLYPATFQTGQAETGMEGVGDSSIDSGRSMQWQLPSQQGPGYASTQQVIAVSGSKRLKIAPATHHPLPPKPVITSVMAVNVESLRLLPTDMPQLQAANQKTSVMSGSSQLVNQLNNFQPAPGKSTPEKSYSWSAYSPHVKEPRAVEETDSGHASLSKGNSHDRMSAPVVSGDPFDPHLTQHKLEWQITFPHGHPDIQGSTQPDIATQLYQGMYPLANNPGIASYPAVSRNVSSGKQPRHCI